MVAKRFSKSNTSDSQTCRKCESTTAVTPWVSIISPDHCIHDRPGDPRMRASSTRRNRPHRYTSSLLIKLDAEAHTRLETLRTAVG
jgi:hypothetical protein